MKRILFVCTGNTCRSPMAEAFMKDLLVSDAALAEEYSAASAGISAYEGDEASSKAVSVMQTDWGIDMTGHRANALTEEGINEAYLILTMTAGQKEYISSFYPKAAKKTFILKEYSGAGDTGDISDPFGGSLHNYGICSSEIRKAVLLLVEKLKKCR